MDLLNISPLRTYYSERNINDFSGYESSIEEKDDNSSMDSPPNCDKMSNPLSIESSTVTLNNFNSILNNNYNYNNNNDFNVLNQLNDIESQQRANNTPQRRSSIFNRLYGKPKPRVRQRISILGKPMLAQRINTNFYQEKVAVYNFLQRPSGCIAIGYHIFVSLAVFTCLVLTVFTTIAEYEERAAKGLKVMDYFIVVFLTSEFVARLWSSSCISHYQGLRGKFYFIRNPFRIIDLFVIVTSSLVMFVDLKGHAVSTSLRGFHFFQVFQMLRLEHRFRPWKMMASVVWDQREHLGITAYMGFLALLFISCVVYFVEKDYNPQFTSIADAMWWGLVTLCTVGYGDITPITPLGKLLSCFCIIAGVCIFALPAGILGTGLALKVQEQQRQRQMGKRRVPAAKLIQCTWRCYAASHNSTSIVTWKTHLVPNSKYYTLNETEKNAVRFIRTVKYFTARRYFNTAFKPYDIKDVLEQYAAGHADVLGRVKHMQSRLYAIQATANLNTSRLQESKVMLMCRITRIEEIVTDMHSKLEELTNMRSRDNRVISSLTSMVLSEKSDSNQDITQSSSNKLSSSGSKLQRRLSF